MSVALPAPPLSPMFGWRRVRVVLIACAVLTLFGLLRGAPLALTLLRLLLVGALQLAIFGLFERWPARLPPWIARWALQVIGVAVVVPFALAAAYALTSVAPAPWFHDAASMKGYSVLAMLGLLTSPWIAIAATLRQIKDEARNQALAFELERSEFERRALDARLRLLQAQVEPHFLFNTLANVRELVESGSPQAAPVLDSLIAYLGAAVPRLHEASTTLAQEFELARAYLDVMQMRMPDRLQFALSLDPACAAVTCPPMMVLTLVENAIRHGIDPSVNGGRVDIVAVARAGRCTIEVVDSGIGLHGGSAGLGTGLATLRERLQLAYGDRATLQLSAVEPHGTRATIAFPLPTSAGSA